MVGLSVLRMVSILLVLAIIILARVVVASVRFSLLLFSVAEFHVITIVRRKKFRRRQRSRTIRQMITVRMQIGPDMRMHVGPDR